MTVAQPAWSDGVQARACAALSDAIVCSTDPSAYFSPEQQAAFARRRHDDEISAKILRGPRALFYFLNKASSAA